MNFWNIYFCISITQQLFIANISWNRIIKDHTQLTAPAIENKLNTSLYEPVIGQNWSTFQTESDQSEYMVLEFVFIHSCGYDFCWEGKD